MSTIGECINRGRGGLNNMLSLIIGIIAIIAIIIGSVTKVYFLIALGSLYVITLSSMAIVSIYQCKNEIL